MSTHELRPKQLRALLLLLVLVPLIPMALMIRFMVEALKGERLQAIERTQQIYTDQLEKAVSKAPIGDPTAMQRAGKLREYVAGFVGPEVSVRIIDGTGHVLAGEVSPWGQAVAQVAAPDGFQGLVQAFLTGPELLDEAVSGQLRIYVWTGVITTLALLLITGTAALAVRRQVELHELKSTSVATVAHELRTPLGSMRMLVDTLREGRYHGEAQLRDYLDLIASENERLSRLAESFLTFSRLDQAPREPELAALDPRTVALQAVEPLKARLEAQGCTFAFEVPASLPAVLAERDSLAQVLANLLDNAMKYSGPERKITLRARAEAGMLAFEVEDNGIGIPPDQRQLIFEPFYQMDQRLSRSREGCGLGLAIVRRIVVAHGGKIEVAGDPKIGSVFTVRIPLA